VLFIEPTDFHLKQTTFLERIYKLAKKSSKFLVEFDKKLSLSEIVAKAKKGNLSKEEKINLTIPKSLAEMKYLII
jgi:hypothetical protein